MKILAVDDNATNLEIIKLFLISMGHVVIEATDGETALAIARSERPDLVFMDLAMPGEIDGLEATRLLKLAPETDQIKVIALTAMVTRTDQSSALEAGCDAFIRKPYSRRDLLEAIQLCQSLPH